MADIFISYSRRDEEFVSKLYRELLRFRVRGFMDQTDLAAGADFSRQMRDAIENADSMVVVLSKSALSSSWVMAELGMAESLGKRIIPILAPGESYDEAVPPHLVDRLVLDSSKFTIEETAAHVAAAATGTSVNEATQQLRSTHMRRTRAFVLAVVTLIAVASTSTSLYYSIRHERRAAELMAAQFEARKAELSHSIGELKLGMSSRLQANDRLRMKMNDAIDTWRELDRLLGQNAIEIDINRDISREQLDLLIQRLRNSLRELEPEVDQSAIRQQLDRIEDQLKPQHR